MKAQIQNFRGIESAEIDFDKIALVTGDNAAGKTSALLPIACALAGVTTPLGLRKTDGGMLVRVGTGRAQVDVTGPDGGVSIEWPKAERSTKGTPPGASKIAVGLESIVDMDPKDRGTLLGALLKIIPNRDDLNQGLTDAGMIRAPKDDPDRFAPFDKVWATIERDGWDAAAERAQKAGTEQKGAWRQITGEPYGSKKADTWQPDGWDGALAQRSKESLESDVAAERNELEFKVGKQAVSAERIAELEALAGTIEDRETALDDAKKSASWLRDVATAARTAREACLPATQSAGHPCPSCGTKLELVPAPGNTGGKQLATVSELSSTELDERRKAIASADGALEKANSEARAAASKESEANSTLSAARAARTELDGGATTDGASAAEVDKAREAVRRAENALKAFTTKTEADRIHAAIQRNETLVGILATSGVRRAVLLRALATFNERLATVCADAKWEKVAMTDAMTVEYADRPYALLSGSEKYRAAATFQVAIAELDGSCACVMDGADILDNAGRAGLMRMLVARNMPAVVGMTMAKSAPVPPLAEKGLGFVYRVDNGKSDVIGGAE
ncbi:MAG: AAA family ATPase [Parvibaculum sp.]|nr:AAA family ATPase [Parvibaculum sp.]